MINKGFSLSLSADLSLDDRISPHEQQSLQTEDRYAGIPFEVNVLWFKSVKKRYRIYGIIPVGKPTGFGGSFGFKLSGNISAHSYASLGVVFGQGYHKSY